MDDFWAAGAPAAGGGAPSWIDVLEDTIGAVQQREREIYDAAFCLLTKLAGWAQRSDAAVAAACRLKLHARVQLNRQHNEQQPPLILRLPDNALELIARKMGKRARLLCWQLCLAHGSPGAVLAPPFENSCCPHGHALSSAHAAALQLWPHPVRRLDLGRCSLDAIATRTIIHALPGLQELHASSFNPTASRRCPAVPLPSLTSLRARQAPYDLRCVPAFTPNLRSLHLSDAHQGPALIAMPSMVWGALAALPGLESLHLPLSTPFLTPSADFCDALAFLTALTHLGLTLRPEDNINTLPGEDSRAATRALAALPLLASVDLANFRMLGPSLGPALQALPALRVLALNQQHNVVRLDPPELPAGCLPTLSTLSALEELAVTGDAVVGSEELRRATSGGCAPLKALALQVGGKEHVPAVCDLLDPLTALTGLSLQLCGGAREQQEGRLAATVAQLPLLRRLQVRSIRCELAPAPAAAPALTCLEMRVARGGLWDELRAVEGLGRLRKLVLLSEVTTADDRQRCMEAVRKLPLLEEAEVGSSEWTAEDLGMLLPPPGQLKALVLALPSAALGSSGPSGAAAAGPGPGVAAAVEQLERYGVHVTQRRARG